MSEESETKIIVVSSLIDAQTPAVQPFSPKELSCIFNELVLQNVVRGINKETEAVLFHSSYIAALGAVLTDSVEAYFKNVERSESIPQIPFSFMLDSRSARILDENIERIIQTLGVAERAFLQTEVEQQEATLNETEGLERVVNDERYAFNLIAGQSFINVMSRLFSTNVTDKAIYEQFMLDALSYKMAGKVLQAVAPLCDEGVRIPFNSRQMTWGNLVKEAAPRLDPRYVAFKI